MTRIALDTNVWIYLTKPNFIELWDKFKTMKETEEIEVIVNDIILLEWERNKEKTIQNLSESIKNEYKSALKLIGYLNSETKSKFLDAISEYREEENRIEKARSHVQEIENFMKSCTIYKVTDKQKLFIANLAITKQAPFHNNKNNYNDALIIRNICENMDTRLPMKYDLIYVSKNPDDFIDKATKEVYPFLFHQLEPIRLMNVTELGKALNLAPELIEDFDEWLETMLDAEAQYQLDIMRGK